MSDGGTPASGQSLSVVPEKVREVGKYVYELAEALRSALDSAAKDVASLTDGSWTGDAANEFSEGPSGNTALPPPRPATNSGTRSPTL